MRKKNVTATQTSYPANLGNPIILLKILKVNYQPIFKDARRMLGEAFVYDEAMANKVLTQLCDAACTLIESHLPQIRAGAGLTRLARLAR